MTDLIPTTAFGTATPRSVTHGALHLSADTTTALATLSPRKGTSPPAPFGLTLPGPGRWAAGADAQMAVWMAPGQWLILGPGQADTDFAATLSDAAPGCSVTEQTDGWAMITVTAQAGAGPLTRLLEKTVNLAPAALAPGCAARSLIGHLGVTLVRRAPDTLIVLGMGSAMGSLWHHIETAAKRLA